MLIRNMFIMDEKDSLVIGCGIFPEWLQKDTTLLYGPTLTPFGEITVRIECREGHPEVRLTADWYALRPKQIVVCLPGFAKTALSGPDYHCVPEVKA